MYDLYHKSSKQQALLPMHKYVALKNPSNLTVYETNIIKDKRKKSVIQYRIVRTLKNYQGCLAEQIEAKKPKF